MIGNGVPLALFCGFLCCFYARPDRFDVEIVSQIVSNKWVVEPHLTSPALLHLTVNTFPSFTSFSRQVDFHIKHCFYTLKQLYIKHCFYTIKHFIFWNNLFKGNRIFPVQLHGNNSMQFTYLKNYNCWKVNFIRFWWVFLF